MERICSGRALSFIAPTIQAGRSYRFGAQHFPEAVTRYAIGAPLRLFHHRRAGTISNLWTDGLGLHFSAALDGPAASEAVELLRGPGHVGASLAVVFTHKGGDVLRVTHIEEVSLTVDPACLATGVSLGADPDEPPAPAVWWGDGPPPLPWDMSEPDRARVARFRKG